MPDALASDRASPDRACALAAPLFEPLQGRPPAALPAGIGYAALGYRSRARDTKELARLTSDLPEALASAAPRRRIEYLAGRRCAKAAVRQVTGRLASVGSAPSGAPIWPEGLTGSISHSQGRAVAVAACTADWGSLGVDVEATLGAKAAHELAPLILTACERARFASALTPAFATLVFSIKEALYKALHPEVGHFFDHHAAQILSCDPTGSVTLELTQDLSSRWVEGRCIEGRFWSFSSHVLTLVWTSPASCHTLLPCPESPT